MHRELWCLKEKICIFKYGWDRTEKVILTDGGEGKDDFFRLPCSNYF